MRPPSANELLTLPGNIRLVVVPKKSIRPFTAQIGTRKLMKIKGTKGNGGFQPPASRLGSRGLFSQEMKDGG